MTKHIKKLVYLLSIVVLLLLSSCADTLIGDEGKSDEDIYLNYQTITVLELPFEEAWYINTGGRTHSEGFHHFITRGSGQRYAMDISIKINGRLSSGDGSANEDYYCYGKRLNAPGAGKIIAIENNIEENIPGVLNGDQPAGNYIIIDHLNGEFSQMAHFKKHSIIVSIGDMVIKGQKVGEAGNSGNSTGPHLHYQLQTTGELLKGIGLPAQFTNYFADDIFIERGEPIKNQTVRKH